MVKIESLVDIILASDASSNHEITSYVQFPQQTGSGLVQRVHVHHWYDGLDKLEVELLDCCKNIQSFIEVSVYRYPRSC